MAKMVWMTDDGNTFFTATQALEHEEKFQNKHIDDVAKIRIKEVLGDIDNKIIDKMLGECSAMYGIFDEYIREILED